jgi:PAS domain S-box-containing protein
MQLASERGDALKLSEDRWRFAIDGSGDGLWDWDIQNNHVFYSSRWLALLGLEDDAAGHDPQVWSSHLHPQDKDRVLAQVQSHLDAQTSHYANEHRVICKDGSTKWLLGRGLVVQRDAEGRPLRMIGTNSDITERKRTEFDLQQSLLDKDALLKEVHHRVKNNLQVITSLLRLEAGRSLVTDTKEVLGYMRGRIRTLAQLHESLYRSGTFASVDLGVYLGQVATQAFKTQELHRDSVLLTLNLGSVQSGMDQATAAGLLLNELISNCLKHGFPEGQTGEVSVALQPANDQDKPPDGRWCLCVKDTGVGLPPNFEDKRKSSLGLKLVADLSHQLGGTLVIDAVPGAGARFSVVFTVQAPVALVMPS